MAFRKNTAQAFEVLRQIHAARAESLSNNPGVGPRPSEDKPGKERRRPVSTERYGEEARRSQAQPQPAEASRDYCSGSEPPRRLRAGISPGRDFQTERTRLPARSTYPPAAQSSASALGSTPIPGKGAGGAARPWKR